jgi:hypothetical protein
MPSAHRSSATLLGWRFACPLSLLLAVLIAPGCAFWGKADPAAFERMDIQGRAEIDDDGELEGDLHADTTVKSALTGAGAGIVTMGGLGAATGLAVSTGCGPFLPLCVGPAVAVWGGGGAVVGLLGGSIIGGIGGLPRETAEQVNEILLELQRTRDFPEEIRAAMAASVPAEKQLDRSRADEGRPEHLKPDAIVTARLDEVKLRQHYSDRVSLRMWASMIMDWELDTEEPNSRTCEYRYTSATADIENWLLQDGKLFHDTFTEGVDTFARWMARDLEAFATKTELPETDDAPETCFQD